MIREKRRGAIGWWLLWTAGCAAPGQRPNLPPPEYEVRPQTPYEVPRGEDPLEAALSDLPEAAPEPTQKIPLDERRRKSERAPDAGVQPESDDLDARDNQESHSAPAPTP